MYGAAMTAAARHRIMSIEDFLAWEARQDTKYEFDGFEPVAMAGGSRNHARIQRNLAIAIGSRLQGTRCEFLGSDMKLLSANRSRYPDGQVVCGPGAGEASFTTSPTALFEVVSAGDETRDRVDKAAEYLEIASVQTYVMLRTNRAEATVLTRTGDTWDSREVHAGAMLTLPSIGVELPLSEIYAGTTVPS